METITIALKYASSSKYKLVTKLFLGLLIIFVITLIEKYYLYGRFIFIIISCVAVVIALLFILYFKIKFQKSTFKNSMIYAQLDKLGYADEFVGSIDTEIKSNTLIDYSYSIYRLRLIVTKIWLVFISKNGSVIRKMSDVEHIYKSFLPTRSCHIIVIKFTDGTVFSNRCNQVSEEIIELLNEHFPKKYFLALSNIVKIIFQN